MPTATHVAKQKGEKVTKSWTEDGQTVYYHDACVAGTDVEQHGAKVKAGEVRADATCGKCGQPLLGDSGEALP